MCMHLINLHEFMKHAALPVIFNPSLVCLLSSILSFCFAVYSGRWCTYSSQSVRYFRKVSKSHCIYIYIYIYNLNNSLDIFDSEVYIAYIQYLKTEVIASPIRFTPLIPFPFSFRDTSHIHAIKEGIQ